VSEPRRPVRRLAMGAAVLALLGVWVSHAAEYARTGGRVLSAPGVPGAIHPYMLPVAVVLVLAAALGAARLWHAWVALSWRLARTRAGIRAAWRGHGAATAAAEAAELPPFGCRLATLWPALASVQISLYVLQENLEARWSGLPLPGLGPVTGVHRAAPLIHLGVALLLAIGAAAVLAGFRRRAHAVAASERLLRVLQRALTGRFLSLPRDGAWTPSPEDLFGTHILRRPPPRPSIG
jgi:hypothetical protein